jgi:hypothetical protein
MGAYLIYHPPRVVSQLENRLIYHDSTKGNQDPYIWNTGFLHSYCHITQMSPQIGDINFWVSGDTFPNFSHLYCDLVFVVAEKRYWTEANTIAPKDSLVDSPQAYRDHYVWASQHFFNRRRRFTLKADPERSFQPQNSHQQLIDIVPYLNNLGLSTEELQQGLWAGFTSQPYHLSSHAKPLYDYLAQQAAIKLVGAELEAIRKQNPQLASPSSEIGSCSG